MNSADREILPLLSGWLDGELNTQETQRVEAALQRSAELRAIVDEWRSVDQTIAQPEAGRSEGEWEALALRVEDAIAAEASKQDMGSRGTTRMSRTPGWSERLQSWFGARAWAVGGSGALAAVVLLVLLWPNSQQLLKNAGVVEQEPSPPAASPPAAGAAPEAADLFQGEGARKDDKASESRSERRRETVDRIDSVVESLEDSDKRQADRDQAAPHFVIDLPQAQPSQAGRVFKVFGAMNRTDEWLSNMNHKLNAALAAENRGDLQSIIDEIERHRAEMPDSQSDVDVLGLTLRARGEFLKLFPDALANDNACATLHADFARYQELADKSVEESSEGARLRALLGEICPE